MSDFAQVLPATSGVRAQGGVVVFGFGVRPPQCVAPATETTTKFGSGVRLALNRARPLAVLRNGVNGSLFNSFDCFAHACLLA